MNAFLLDKLYRKRDTEASSPEEGSNILNRVLRRRINRGSQKIDRYTCKERIRIPDNHAWTKKKGKPHEKREKRREKEIASA